MNDPIIIIGAGLAGYTLARELRKRDRDVPLMMISRDTAAFYSKPMLSGALAMGKDAAALVNQPADKMAADLGMTILANTEVARLDTVARELVLANGPRLAWRQLVLALGADPIRLPLQGDAPGRVLSVNHLADYARFREQLPPRGQVVILGAGLIGCEFANDLLASGHRATLVDPGAQVLGRLLPAAAAEHLHQRLTDAGADCRLGCTATQIDLRDDGRLQVTLSDGERLVADVVLSAVGLSPATALARAAGLAVNRGIVVDNTLATSAPSVFALGDCVELDGRHLPYVQPIMLQARALAATLTGQRTAVQYPAMPIVVKTPACPTVVCPPADPQATWHQGDTLTADVGNGGCLGDSDSLAMHALAGDHRLAGFVLMGKAIAARTRLAQAIGQPVKVPAT